MDLNQEPTGPSSPSVRNAHRPAQNALDAIPGRQGPDICDHKESGLPNQYLYAKDDDDSEQRLIKLKANMALLEDLNRERIESLTSSIQALFQTAQDCFDAIPARHGPETEKISSKLKQWREKAFDSAGSFDMVFESSKLACQPLRQCVLIILARMLLWGGPFQPSAKVAAAIKSTEKLLTPSVWRERVDLPGAIKMSASRVSNLHDLVEALHYLLPALIETHRFEEASVPNIEETGGEYREYDEHYFADAQEGFKDAEEILKKLDKAVGKKGAPGYALRLNLEKERLDVVDTLCKSRKDMITKTSWSIHDEQVNLEFGLGKYCSLSYHTHLLRLLTILAGFKSSAEKIARHKIVKFVNKLQAKNQDKDNPEALISLMHQRNKDLEDLLHKRDVLDEEKALESNSGTSYAQ